MGISLNVSMSNFGHYSMMKKNTKVNNDLLEKKQSVKDNENRITQLKKKIKQNAEDTKDSNSQRIAEQSSAYAESLQTQRTQRNSTSKQIKKLKYNFKKISSQLLRCKTAASAKIVVGAAKRATVQLKRQLAQGDYDEEEVQMAIAHSEAMERVAKKKQRNLEEEELVKVKDDEQNCSNSEEITDRDIVELGNDETSQGLSDETSDENNTEQLYDIEPDNDMSEELFDEVSDDLKELMENQEMPELEDLIDSKAGSEMNRDDFKKLKLKHRSNEMKMVTKADSEYLKGMFDKYEKEHSEGVSSTQKVNDIQSNIITTGNNGQDISFAGGIDISI